MTEPGEEGTERILTLCLHTTDRPVSLISVYAPTLHPTQEAKDEFYHQLQSAIHKIPPAKSLLLLSDFNT